MTRISLKEAGLAGATVADGARAVVRAVPSRTARPTAGMLFSAVVLAMLVPLAGHAAMRDVTIRWYPSPTEGAMDYVLSIGTSAGIYLSHMPLSNPSVSGGVWSKIVQLDDSTNLYVALRAVDDVGQYSDYSNEIFVAEDPGFGVTSLEGIPAIPELASGELRVEALVDGDTESVQFSLDGVVVRVENIAPYALNGDNGPGDLIPWDTNTVLDESHTISATGYSQADAAGETGRTVSVTFRVQNAETLGTPGKPTLVVD